MVALLTHQSTASIDPCDPSSATQLHLTEGTAHDHRQWRIPCLLIVGKITRHSPRRAASACGSTSKATARRCALVRGISACPGGVARGQAKRRRQAQQSMFLRRPHWLRTLRQRVRAGIPLRSLVVADGPLLLSTRHNAIAQRGGRFMRTFLRSAARNTPTSPAGGRPSGTS